MYSDFILSWIKRFDSVTEIHSLSDLKSQSDYTIIEVYQSFDKERIICSSTAKEDLVETMSKREYLWKNYRSDSSCRYFIFDKETDFKKFLEKTKLRIS